MVDRGTRVARPRSHLQVQAMNTDDTLTRLAAVIESRKPAHGGNPETSYVARLLHKEIGRAHV